MNHVLKLLVFLSVVYTSSISASEIARVEANEVQGVTQIDMTMSEPTAYKIFSLSKPDRLVIDLIGAKKISKNIVLRSHAIKGLRHAYHRGKYYRVVFDMNGAGIFQHSTSLDAGQFHIRLLWKDKETIKKKRRPSKALTPPPAKPALKTSPKASPKPPAKPTGQLSPKPAPRPSPKPAAQPSLEESKRIEPKKTILPKRQSPPPQKRPRQSLKDLKDVVVVIDPGHGGRDPGAIGKAGIQEKKIVLDVAKHLAQKLNRQFGIRAYLTRHKDQFIDLDERTKIARNKNADLFLSIHADALDGDQNVKGASVYVLSAYRASSVAARWLARKNKTDSFVTGGSIQDKDKAVASMLMDLSQAGTSQHSKVFAQAIMQSLDRSIGLRTQDVGAAGFSVLTAPDIPSILIELGYLSNLNDEKNLSKRPYRLYLADVLYSGLQNYLSDHAPADALIKHYQRGSYRVKSGDTLWGIARQKGISLQSLRKVSKVKSDWLEIGQVLFVPVPK